jgi:predicted SnoaL-like aldol condensation-catalyzing enzyme
MNCIKDISKIWTLGLLAVSLTAWTPVFAQVPVTPAPDQLALLKSSDPREAANKKLVFDFLRVVLDAVHLEDVDKYLGSNYIEHNPTIPSGRDALVQFLKSAPRGEIRTTLKGSVVAITADGELVTVVFVWPESDPCVSGRTYTATQFDMFRIVNGKIVEHWDDTRRGVPLPGGARPCLNPGSGAPASAGTPPN